MNDLGCTAACVPMYALWAKNDYHHYFDKVDDSQSLEKLQKIKQRSKTESSSSNDQVKVMSAEEIGADSKETSEGASSSKSEIEQILSDIELKRAKMRYARDLDFLQAWDDYFCKEGSPGLMLR